MGASAGIALLVTGGAMKYGAEKSAGRAQEALGNYNANISEMQSKDAIARGEESVAVHKMQTRKLIGSERAAFAASGVDISDPDSTAANVQRDTQALSELDQLTIRANAAREAWGFRTQASNQRYRGKIAKDTADQRAIGDLISTGGSAMMMKYGFKNPSSGGSSSPALGE